MNTEYLSVQGRAARYAALGDPARLHIVDLLVTGDRSPGDLGADLNLSSNLLAHHLAILEREGLISRTRSEGDHRRSYIRLHTAALKNLGSPQNLGATGVVFVCTGNSARSPLAAALWARNSPIAATSAGTHPAPAVAPLAAAVAAEYGLDISEHKPRAIEELTVRGDLLITVCDRAHEQLRTTSDLHWSVPNPSATGTPRAYQRTYTDLSARITALASHLKAP